MHAMRCLQESHLARNKMDTRKSCRLSLKIIETRPVRSLAGNRNQRTQKSSDGGTASPKNRRQKPTGH